MEAAIVAGVYSYVVKQTPEQREADEDHGIMENDADRLHINQTAFSLNFHYYYEYEAMYVMRQQKIRDVKLEGKVQVESPGVWLCEVEKGSYENSTLSGADKGEGLTGRFKVKATADGKVRIVEAMIHEKDGKVCLFAKNKLLGGREMTRE